LRRSELKPFLKWAGGKGQLLTQIKDSLPQKIINRKIKAYIEPFVGGGAVFFDLHRLFDFEKVILNDYNVDLMMTYKSICEDIDELVCNLYDLEKIFINSEEKDRKKMFYNIREVFNKEKESIDYSKVSIEIIKHSANMIFLNKTCFNGLYRLNSKGGYNVPFGYYKNPKICDEKNLRNVSSTLKRVTLIYGDFENLTEHIDKETFVYIDPPYRPLSGTSSFNNYQKAPFNDESQKRLAQWYKYLDVEKKALLMLSNSDPKNTDQSDNFFDEIYKDYNINRVQAKRVINSKGSGRGLINELLITNYLPYR
jgi:DNA adenine methylase